MFDKLSERIGGVFDGLNRSAKLTEEDLAQAMREVRLAMLEADVALPVVRGFVNDIREKALGQKVPEDVSPGQMVARIVNDSLVEILGGTETKPFLENKGASKPQFILMAGLQGAGKTTTAGKLALRLAERNNMSVLLASLDVHRPGAQLQLARLGDMAAERVGSKVQNLPVVEGQGALEIAKRASNYAKQHHIDLVILDTAGRQSIDQELMDEISAVAKEINPDETLLVVDAMTGQDAATTAKAFGEALPLTGVVLSRMDGDAKGGAALSMREVAGVPIRFSGQGEKLDALEDFYPERVASRILGLGDVAGLVERAEERIDKEEGERLAKRMLAGKFDLNDYAAQLKMLDKMGSIGGILGMMPGMGKFKDALDAKGFDGSIFKRHRVMISSMTNEERINPDIIKASRKKRIAKGSGSEVSDVNRLLKQFNDMATMMKRFNKMGLSGMMQAGGNGTGAVDQQALMKSLRGGGFGR